MSLLRHYQHQLRYHQRFYVAMILTVVVLSYVGVPLVVRLVESVGSYNPAHYEPKDTERGLWIERRGAELGFSGVGWLDIVKIALVVLTGLAWVAVGPTQSPRRRSSRR
jgi:hypothetical protein